MKRLTKHLIIISFDGLSTLDFEYMKSLPNFGDFIKESFYCKKVYSVYPTLTYPAHATIVTGKYPKNHGIINNTQLQPFKNSPDWYWQRKYIKGETLYDIAINSGMKVAALLWPVTAKSKINFNMPEIFANRPWHNQIIVSLLNGSPLYQFKLNNKFGSLGNGIVQPNLDNFTHQSLLYTIKEKMPDMVLVHYTDLDTMRHNFGFNSDEAEKALKRHDSRLGDIIKILKDSNIYEDSTIVALGDHSSLDEDKIINLNILFKEKGYIEVNKKGKITDYKVILKNCDGSAYVYLKDKLNNKVISEIKALIETFNEENRCIEEIYRTDEVEKLGADPQCSLMLEAKRGYYFSDHLEGEIIRKIQPHEAENVYDITNATHGYSPFKENYTTVFMAAGCGVNKSSSVEEMNLIDEAPTMAKLLGLELKNTDGKVIKEFFESY